MKNKALFVVLMVVVWGGVGGFRIYQSMQHAGQAQQALAGDTPFSAQVLAVVTGGRRGGNSAVKLRAQKDPAGGNEPATLDLGFHQFDDASALRPGASVDMLYDAAARDATERRLLEKQATWTYWVFK